MLKSLTDSAGRQLKEKELDEEKQKLRDLESIVKINELKNQVQKIVAWETVWEQQRQSDTIQNRLDEVLPRIEKQVYLPWISAQ